MARRVHKVYEHVLYLNRRVCAECGLSHHTVPKDAGDDVKVCSCTAVVLPQGLRCSTLSPRFVTRGKERTKACRFLTSLRPNVTKVPGKVECRNLKMLNVVADVHGYLASPQMSFAADAARCGILRCTCLVSLPMFVKRAMFTYSNLN